jgi:NADH:ubiquinone oxidoreductase subunit 4 (subunit M)
MHIIINSSLKIATKNQIFFYFFSFSKKEKNHQHMTQLVNYYGGLVSTMPLFFTLFLFFIVNMSLLGTSSFIGEFFILIGACQSLVATLAALGMILGAAYSL